MDADRLRDLWHENNDRPAFVRAYRDELDEHTNTGDPVPDEDESMFRFRKWLEQYKATVSRQLNEAAGDDAGASTEGEPAAAEGGA